MGSMSNPPPSVRERILGATLRIIGESGIAAVTNRRIAKEAGVSLGSVTYHFATQTELLRESLRSFVAEQNRKLNELTQQYGDTSMSLEEAAAVIAEITDCTTPDSRHIAPFEIYIEAGRDPQLRAFVEECFHGYDQLAATLLGALGIAGPEHLTRVTVAAIMGLQLRGLATTATGQNLADELLLLLAPHRSVAQVEAGGGVGAERRSG
jgi:DNA-binding transcriptional regulator YbjK